MTFLNKKNLVRFFLVFLILASFGVGFYFGRISAPPVLIEGVINLELGKPKAVDFSLFWDAWRVLQEKYVDKENLNFQEMVYGAISGMVEALGDPYTIFLTPEESKIFEEEVAGKFEGVGMEIGIRNGELIVIAPLENTPAQRAGLRAGDKIIKVNGTFTRNITIDEAVKLIRGPRETKVTLTILREGWAEPKEFKIIRDVIEIPSLKWELKDNNIAYINLYHFSEKARYDFAKSAMEILKSPAKKIILDLRNNPGGYLEVAQEIASWFLEKGQIVAIEDFGEGRKKIEFQAFGNAKLLPYPLVILINQGSASGSEILAGSLRDNRDIILIGETSFGKGTVQELEKLKDKSSLKITVAKWLTPKGNLITDQGLTPDIEVEMTEEDYEEDRDPQLDKAIEIIRSL